MGFLKAIILYPLGGISGSREPSRVSPSRPIGFDPGRELQRIGHEKRRAHIRSVARQIRAETGLPPHPALERAA